MWVFSANGYLRTFQNPMLEQHPADVTNKIALPSPTYGKISNDYLPAQTVAKGFVEGYSK
jgi:hypothetical protein